MNTKKLVETALTGLDDLGFRLEALGVTDKLNRHVVIAALLAEKRNIEGELESLRTRVISRKARVTQFAHTVETRVNDVVDFALRPAKYALNSIRGLVQS